MPASCTPCDRALMTGQSHIAIVDDDASVRRALSRLIRSAGYETEAFESAEAFLDTESTGETSLLILDVHLPAKNGLELQSELMKTGRQIPTVFITAFDDQRARDQATEAGTLAFLRKPLDSERLLQVIQSALTVT